MTHRSCSVLAAMLLALLLAGCSGSSGSGNPGPGQPGPSDPGPGDPDPNEPGPGGGGEPDLDFDFSSISGAALAPSGWLTAGGTGMARGTHSVQAFDGAQTMDSHDTPAGLSPVGQGIVVELVFLADDGTAVEPPLAETMTSETGSYILEFPDGVAPGANLGVRFSINGQDLHAQAVTEQLDVSPISEYVIQKLVEQKARLGAVSPEAVVKLRGVVAEFEFEYEGSTLQDVLESMNANDEAREAALASALEAKPSGSADHAADLEGVWRYATLSLALGDVVWGDERRGTLEATLGSGPFLLTAPAELDDGEMIAEDGDGEHVFWAFDDPMSHETISGVWYEHEIFEGGEQLELQVGADRALYLFEQPGVDVHDDTAHVYPATTLKLLPAGNDAFAFVAPTSELLFGVTETNGIDKDNPRGRRVGAELGIFTRQGESGIAAVHGKSYGVVGLEVAAFDHGELELQALLGTLGTFALAGEEAISNATVDVWDVTRTPGLGGAELTTPGGGDLISVPSETVTGSITLAQGDAGMAVLSMDIDGEEGGFSFDGFVSADGSLIAVLPTGIEGGDEQSEGPVEEAFSALWLALELGAPEIGGNRYAARSLDVEFGDDGTVKLERVTAGEMVFSADATSADLSGIAGGFVERSGGGAEVSIERPAPEDVGELSVEVASNGHVKFPFDDTALEGFASADGSLIVLSRRYDARATGAGEVGMGLWILTRIDD